MEKGEKISPTQYKALGPLVETLRQMIAAARQVFNRHSQSQLEEMARLRRGFTLDVDPFFELVETGLKKDLSAERPNLLKFQGVLTHLELMADKIGGLADQLRYKANHGIILSEKDLFTVNNLFARLSGLMGALADILATDDASLKAYVLQESRQLAEECYRLETSHETEMMDTPGQPDAWSVFLAILSASREVAGHLTEIVKSLD
jgi:Na+/phosphate symporter